MANEAVLLREVELPISFTVADNTGIEKGTLLKMTDPNTASANAAHSGIVAGIAAQEKIADNGQTKLAVYQGGDFKVLLSGSATVGDALAMASAANSVYSLDHDANAALVVNLSGNVVFGIAKETGTTGETIRVELKPQAISHI